MPTELIIELRVPCSSVDDAVEQALSLRSGVPRGILQDGVMLVDERELDRKMVVAGSN